MNLVTPTGSLINNIYANSEYPRPQVGMGATELMYTDRHACTIVEVRCNKAGEPRTIVVQRDCANRTDANGMSESQSYEYTPNPDGAKDVVTLRKNGRWVKQGESAKSGASFAIGARREYHDYSF